MLPCADGVKIWVGVEREMLTRITGDSTRLLQSASQTEEGQLDDATSGGRIVRCWVTWSADGRFLGDGNPLAPARCRNPPCDNGITMKPSCMRVG